MHRRNFFISILLVALAVSGWGSLLAASLCPYAAKTAAIALKTTEHASCHAQGGAAVATAHDQSSTHEAMGYMEATTPTRGESPSASAQLVQSCRPCCISHGNLPNAPAGGVREARADGREKHQAAAQDVKAIAPPVAAFVPAIVPTQGSPPGQPVRRHLLLSVFII